MTEQDGRIVRLGQGDPVTVLDVTDLTEMGGEQGLLGLTFAPGGDVAYINYTDNNGDTVISEHQVTADGTFGTGDLARIVLEIDQPYDNHNGGDLTFGPDGLLYIGMGDGGAGGDPERRATDLSTPLGKILRIDPAIAGSALHGARRTTRSSASPARPRRSGRVACATRGGSPSTGRPVTCGSPTSARRPGRRSTSRRPWVAWTPARA